MLADTGTTLHVTFDSAGNRLAEYDQATGSLLREYVWFEGQLIAVLEAGQVYLVRTDHIGRPSFATDQSGTVVWTVDYLPFGEVFVSTGTPINLRFPGQWFQAESGLHQNWMRDYDPTTGRYIQPDPLGLVDGASVYGYVRQSPPILTDPTGECPWCAGALIIFAVTALTPDTANAPGLCDEIVELDEFAPYINGAVAGIVFGPGFWAGAEYGVGSNGARVAPYGNRWFFPTKGGRNWNASNGKWPHYHRPNVKPGQTRPGPGQSKDRHRPWDSSPFDKSFWDRF